MIKILGFEIALCVQNDAWWSEVVSLTQLVAEV